MSFRLLIVCDTKGCEETAVVEKGSGLNVEPMTTIATDRATGVEGAALFETDWLDVPDEWTLGDAGDFCPAHRPE